MFARYFGALVRAAIVPCAVVLPSVLLPGRNDDMALPVGLIALFAAGLTFFEYASTYPGMIEFRFAPPYNRMRFLTLTLTLLLLTVASLARTEPTTLNLFIEAVGGVAARLMDVAYSPLRLLVLMLPDEAPAARVEAVRVAGGLAALIGVGAVLAFWLVLKRRGWPLGQNAFNVWVNLPTFDPTGEGDVVRRLTRDAWANVILGFLLPFLLPAVVKLVSVWLTPVTLESPLAMIWLVTAWAFLPASLVMRGMALGRVAQMIDARRRALVRSQHVLAI